MATRGSKCARLDSTMLRGEQLILFCDWGLCRMLFHDMEKFLAHVAEHAGQVAVSVKDDELYITCMWEDCGFGTCDQKEILRHIYFHAYHTKVKCLGANMIEQLALQGCQLDQETRNAVPELSEPFICCWEDCQLEYLNVQQFYWHVHTHSYPSTGKRKRCLWASCQSSFPTQSKLKDHLKTHTQERPLACPTCGSLFVSRTKLHDHCLRQLPLDANEFRCCECKKLLPTERLLREHMRYHRSDFICPHCPADGDIKKRSFTSTHSLASHINYCHSDLRPFACTEPECNYSAKSQTDLNRHIEVHDNTLWYCCEVSGCGFTSKTSATLQKHVRKIHEGLIAPQYGCHICQQRFQCSNSLKRHLGNIHQFVPQCGAGRFKYQLDRDGIFRVENSNQDQADFPSP